VSTSSSSTTSADVVLRFLESVGRRAESEFYVQLFRAEPKEQFGAISVDANVARHATEAVVLHLRFLAGLGLAPVVVLGAFEPTDAAEHAGRIARRLTRQGVAVAQVSSSDNEALATATIQACRDGIIPIIAFSTEDGTTVDDRFARLGSLIGRLQSRKLIFLHRPGGLRQNGALLPLVNLTTDVPSLVQSRELTRKERAIVQQSQRIVAMEAHKLVVTVTSPLNLLRELFTVKGAGTMLRRGSMVVRHTSYDTLDVVRLRALIASSFGREPLPAFFERPVLRVYLEDSYRGCAVVTESPLGPYLTKFATDREARGEGIARDLWDSMMDDCQTVFWRARANNPINEWYTRLADGILKTSEWWVFWKGIDLAHVASAVTFALAQPVDLPPPAAGVTPALPLNALITLNQKMGALSRRRRPPPGRPPASRRTPPSP
jgi:bifunctional N-acetylglutamate synthase/kinase